MSFSITPSKKNLVVKPTSIQEIGGGLLEVAASSDKERPSVGVVLKVGGGAMPVPIKTGDLVAYRRFGESKFLLGGEEVIFVSFDDVLGVIRKEK